MKLKELNPMRGPHVVFGKGALNMLNDANDDSLLIMFREAVQNSWDARILDEGGINFEIKGYSLNSDNISYLNQLFDDSEYGLSLINKLKDDSHVIEVADSGTHGLTGPVGYDFESDEIQERYLKFIYDIGNPQDEEKAGGSYGFGKTSFYKLSKVGFNAIYTRIKTDAGFESRLIFKCINRKEKLSKYNIGAYWWGKDVHQMERPGSPYWATPLTNTEADSVWKSIGGSPFESQQTGTKILVFCPNFFDDDLKSEFQEVPSWSLKLLSRYAIHLFWAKWPKSKSDGINFKFIDNFNGSNEVLKLESPSDIRPYADLIGCLEECKSNSTSSSSIYKSSITTKRPSQKLGIICTKFISYNSIHPSYARFWKSNQAQIALMRNIEFVLRYHDPNVPLHAINDEDENNSKILIGVYRTLDECYVNRFNGDESPVDLNIVYRMSENPSHGKWLSANVQDLGPWCVTYIKRTVPEIEKFVRGVVGELSPKKQDSTLNAEVELMTMLGGPISGMFAGGGTSPVSNNGLGGSTGMGLGAGRHSAAVNIPSYEVLGFERFDTDEGSTIDVKLKLRDADINTPYLIAPICNDENGRFTISNNGKYKISLPVKITYIRIDNSSISQLTILESGSAKFELSKSECEITVQLELIGECSFILKIST